MRTPIILVTGLLIATPAFAQDRSGFWFDVGLGAGSLNAKVSFGGLSASGSEFGGSGNLALGGTVSPTLQIGGGTFGWVRDTGSMANLMGIVNVFPSPTGHLWLRGGAGYYIYTEEAVGGDLELMGFSGAAGVGYDFLVSNTVGIAPYATVVFGLSSEIKVGGIDSGVNGSLTLFQFGAMLSIN